MIINSCTCSHSNSMHSLGGSGLRSNCLNLRVLGDSMSSKGTSAGCRKSYISSSVAQVSVFLVSWKLSTPAVVFATLGAGATLPYLRSKAVSIAVYTSDAFHASDSCGRYTSTRLPCCTGCATVTVGIDLVVSRVLSAAGLRPLLQHPRYKAHKSKTSFSRIP